MIQDRTQRIPGCNCCHRCSGRPDGATQYNECRGSHHGNALASERAINVFYIVDDFKSTLLATSDSITNSKGFNDPYSVQFARTLSSTSASANTPAPFLFITRESWPLRRRIKIIQTYLPNLTYPLCTAVQPQAARTTTLGPKLLQECI